MTIARLAGLAAAAAIAADADALEDCFAGLSGEESDALGTVAGRMLELHAQQSGDWSPWAELHAEAGRARLREAGAGFRERLDKAINARAQWDIRQRRLAAERATEAVRRAVRPLMRRGAPKAQVEEAAGQAARGALEWDPDIYAILVEEFDACRQPEPAHG